jgi:hypothetical protein
MQGEEKASEAAPAGFENYEAGEYRLFVPFPFSLEGSDDNGPVLLGSQLGVTNTEVLVGTPIPLPGNLSDSDLMNLVRQLAGLHGSWPDCSAIKQVSHKAFRCAWNGKSYLLGHGVWGDMEFVVASSSLIPVMCVSPDEMQCPTFDSYGYHTCAERYPSLQELQRTKAVIETPFRDELTTRQMCEQIIYPSIQLKEDFVARRAMISESKPAKVALAAASAAQEIPPAESTQPGPSLAEIARQMRQAPRAEAEGRLDTAEGIGEAPPGFQPFVVQYCQNPGHCSEASLLIPEKTEVVSRVNGQHIFKAMLEGDPVMLYAGPADVNAPYRSLTDPDYIRIRDLASPKGWSREKTDSISTQELMIEGRPAVITHFRYQRDQSAWWIGKRVLIEDHGMQFLVGCTAPEPRFAEAEQLCTTLINSLRLP